MYYMFSSLIEILYIISAARGPHLPTLDGAPVRPAGQSHFSHYS